MERAGEEGALESIGSALSTEELPMQETGKGHWGRAAAGDLRGHGS